MTSFQTFWNAYGYKRDRIAAERAWNRLSEADKQAAFDGIAAYKADCQRCRRQMMYAQGYLNHRRWEDETDVTPDNVISNGQTTLTRTAASVADQRKEEVRQLQRAATASAAALASLGYGDEEQ